MSMFDQVLVRPVGAAGGLLEHFTTVAREGEKNCCASIHSGRFIRNIYITHIDQTIHCLIMLLYYIHFKFWSMFFDIRILE